MKKSYYLSTTFNEVIFKNRNKMYGAYYLRRIYEKHVILAILFATAGFTTMLAAPLVQELYFTPPEKEIAQEEATPKERVIELPIVPPVPEKQKTAEPVIHTQEKVKSEIYTEPKIVDDDTDIETKELANYEDLKNANFGTEKIEGAPPTVPDVTITDAPPVGLGNGIEEKKPDIYIYVEEMPEFKGGEKAMLEFIGKRIKYPATAQRQGIEGLVVVSFIVSATGEIKGAEVIKGLGYGTDEEALRVVRSMPDWKPGKQNGRTVPVRYTLPIRFSIR